MASSGGECAALRLCDDPSSTATEREYEEGALSNLGYIDDEFNDAVMREKVKRLLDAEIDRCGGESRTMPRGSAKNKSSSFTTALTANELGRARDEKPMKKLNFYSRLENLKQSDNAEERNKGYVLSAGYASQQRTNLELLQRYGAAAWRLHVKDLEGIRDQVETRRAEVQTEVQSVNRRRQEEQSESSHRLKANQREYWSLVRKNAQLEETCSALERRS